LTTIFVQRSQSMILVRSVCLGVDAWFYGLVDIVITSDDIPLLSVYGLFLFAVDYMPMLAVYAARSVQRE